jgi:hypothetical protein
MALVVQTLIVGGIVLFVWGKLRTAWDDRWDETMGKLLMVASILSFGLGGLGLVTVLH